MRLLSPAAHSSWPAQPAAATRRRRYQLLEGKRAAFVPGWDTHGLPIELKVLQSMKSKERASLTPLELRKKAAGFAQETMAKQRASFQRFATTR